jgi:hypothetical protein
MKTRTQSSSAALNEMNCFGDYAKSDPLCTRHCVLRLRCAIEQDQNMRMELLEDLMASDALALKIQ